MGILFFPNFSVAVFGLTGVADGTLFSDAVVKLFIPSRTMPYHALSQVRQPHGIAADRLTHEEEKWLDCLLHLLFYRISLNLFPLPACLREMLFS
jgi:hypothetical protein